jgi:hypothetical protein
LKQIRAHFVVVHESRIARILVGANRLAKELNIVFCTGDVKPSGCHADKQQLAKTQMNATQLNWQVCEETKSL